MSKIIPTSISNFPTLVSGDYYFVDKSLMIKDLVELGDGASLFTRPRRFGKTMNLDMLKTFFDHNVPNGEEIFSRLKIGDYPEVMRHLGKYEVIRMDFTYLESSNMRLFLGCFSDLISNVFSKYSGILSCEKIPEPMRAKFELIMNAQADDSILLSSMPLLCECINTAYGMETVILIDEYDKPVHEAYLKGFYDEFMGIYAPFMERTLKANQNYKFAVLTGVSHLSKETIFSGLNNLKEFDIFRTKCDESFGFTKNEVSALISEIGLPNEQLDVMREYYDGYRFGSEDVYNPYSVMNHLQRLKEGAVNPNNYWVQSGDTSLITDVLVRTTPEFRDRILALSIPGNSIITTINPRLSLRNIQSSKENVLEETAITMMVTSGYLKAVPYDEKKYTITVPNMEVVEAFESLMNNLDIVDRTSVSRLTEYMFSKNSEKATTELNKILKGQSPRDHYDENVHKFFLSILFGFSGYRYQTELGSGDGYVDLYIKGTRTRPGLLMELKYSDEKCDMTRLADSALKQISEMNYSCNIDETHIIVGIGYHKHSAKVVFGDTINVPPEM